jgi:nucleotide-binding universal stress UspA family protein
MVLRKAGFNHFVFLHVIERDKVAMHRGVGYLKEEEVKLREIANVRFIDWAESLFEQGMEVGAYISRGKSVGKIVSTAQEEMVDLIVTGRHKRGKLEELLGGSETMEVLRRTSIPVLVFKYILPSGQTNDTPFERPLLIVDFSPITQKMVSYIITLKEVITQVEVIHVISENSLKETSSLRVQKVRKETNQALDEICDTLRAAGIEADAHLYVGDVNEQVERAAQERDATMIVAGTTSKKALTEKILGSVPRHLAEKSSLPALLVPPDLAIDAD